VFNEDVTDEFHDSASHFSRIQRLPVSGISDAFASSSDLQEILSSAARWVRVAVGSGTSVSITLPDGAGRLRTVWSEGGNTGSGRRRSLRRRTAFVEQKVARIDLPGTDDRTLAVFPLVSRGVSEGLLEVEGSVEAVQAAWHSLEAIADQTAIALRNISQLRELRLGAEAEKMAATFSRELLEAQKPRDAVRTAVEFVYRRTGEPAAGWAVVDDPARMELTAVGGLGSRRRRELRGAAGELPRWGSMTAAERTALIQSVGSLLGADDVAIIDAEDSLLLARRRTEASEASQEFLDAVRSQMRAALDRLARTGTAEQWSTKLDTGIAWAAHELRSPIMGVKAALEQQLAESAEVGEDVIRRSVRALEQVAGTTEDILAWAVGARPLRRRHVNVVTIARDAVKSCEVGRGESRVRIHAPVRARARIDPVQMRVAIANLVRNALTHPNPPGNVELAVEEAGQSVRVSVTDRGPEIAKNDIESIFDPFVRGSIPSRASAPGGLGLFIARRIVEEHGGRIWVESGGGKNTFYIELPIEGEPRTAL
jgi:signal transduction histidine kinase